MSKINREEIIRRYAAGERDFGSIEVPGIDLSNLELPGIYLGYSLLEGANFSGTNLSEGYLVSSPFEGANFSGANLYGVDLYATSWDGVNFSGACLVGANLEAAGGRANLTNANLIGAINVSIIPSIDKAILKNTIMPDGQVICVTKDRDIVKSRYPRTLYLCDLQ